jgi:hypothetical protein
LYSFEFKYDGRVFDIKAKTEELRNKWIKVLNLLKESLSTGSRERGATTGKQKGWKLEQLDKESHEILKKSGLTNDRDLELSKKAISLKISKGLNIQLPEIQSRIYYGFMQKKHKKDYLFQKRWFFIISSRPLTDNNYDNDDTMLDEVKIPKSLTFDTLYYFHMENENDDSQSKGNILLSDCHEVAVENRDDKYFLTLDMGDRKYEFLSDFKGERDMWYEVLRNSRKTSKDIKNSITKKPRNLNKLSNILDRDGGSKLKEICEKEKEKIIGGSKDM